MRTLSIAAVVLAASLAALGARADEGNSLDKRGGFRDAKIGMTLDQLRALDKKSEVTKTREHGKVVFYKRSADEMTLFGSKLESIEYAFRDGRLVGTVVKTAPEERQEGAKDLYTTLPDIVRITAGFEDLLRDARIAGVDEARERRLRSLAETEFKASDVRLDWIFEGTSIVAVVMPIRIDGKIPGNFTTQVVVIYLEKGVDFGEI